MRARAFAVERAPDTGAPLTPDDIAEARRDLVCSAIRVWRARRAVGAAAILEGPRRPAREGSAAA